jgi:hypothetical protein
VLEVAAEEARAAIGAASLSVSRWEREQGALRTIINVGELGPEEERYPAAEVYMLHEDGNAERLIHEGRAYFNSVDSAEIDEVSARRLIWLGKESEVGVPILVEGESGARSTPPPRRGSRVSAARTSASSRPSPASWPLRSAAPSCSPACRGSPTRIR